MFGGVTVAAKIVLPISYGNQNNYNALSEKLADHIYVCGDTGNLYLGTKSLGNGVLFSSEKNISSTFGEIGQYCITPYGVYQKVEVPEGSILSSTSTYDELCGVWYDQGVNTVNSSDGNRPGNTHWFKHSSNNFLVCWTASNAGNWWINKIESGESDETALAKCNGFSYAYFRTSGHPDSTAIPDSGNWMHTQDNAQFNLDWYNNTVKSVWVLFSKWEINEDGDLSIAGKPLDSYFQLFSDSSAIAVSIEDDGTHLNVNVSQAEKNILQVLDDGLYVKSEELDKIYLQSAESSIDWDISNSLLFLDHESTNSLTINIKTQLADNDSDYARLFLHNFDQVSSTEKSISFNIDSGTIYWGNALPVAMQANSVVSFELYKVPSTENTWYGIVNTAPLATNRSAGLVMGTEADDLDESVWGTIGVDSDGKMKVNNLKQLLNVRRFGV